MTSEEAGEIMLEVLEIKQQMINLVQCHFEDLNTVRCVLERAQFHRRQLERALDDVLPLAISWLRPVESTDSVWQKVKDAQEILKKSIGEEP